MRQFHSFTMAFRSNHIILLVALFLGGCGGGGGGESAAFDGPALAETSTVANVGGGPATPTGGVTPPTTVTTPAGGNPPGTATPPGTIPPSRTASNAMELVSLEQVTHRVRQSGPWSDPATWENGVLPGDRARVHIPQNLVLTMNLAPSPRFETVRIDGTLRFPINQDAELRVDTLVSTRSGTFEIGTEAQPVQAGVTARVLFIDDGPVNPQIDLSQVGRGAILMGKTIVHGSPKTHRTTLATHPRQGESTLTLDSVPQGWEVGDELVITGTTVNDPRSDEIRRVNSIQGTTIVLDQPLERDHMAPRTDLDVYIANVTRNIEFSSESEQVPRRGHIMFMATLDVDVQNARFTRLGRTDKTRPLDDLIFEFPEGSVANESSAPTIFNTTRGPATNIRGRYPIHFHRGGTSAAATPGLVKGSVVFDSPGWGFVMHSSHVNFIDNVSYAVQGTGFYTEAGDEVGTMRGNIAIRSVNDNFRLDDEGAIDPDLGAENQEFGNDGDGYWLSGHRVSLIDNVSAGSTAHGIIYWTDGLVEADIPTPSRMTVKVSDIANGHLIPGRTEIPTWWAPLAEIKNNVSYNSTIGFRVRYTHSQVYLGAGGSDFHQRPPQRYRDTLEPTIDGLTVWGNRDGVLLNYTSRMNLKNARILGIGAPFVYNAGTANTGVGLDLGTDITEGFGRVEAVSIEGFATGFVMPRNEQWDIKNLNLKNTVDLLIEGARLFPRTLHMENVTFGDLSGTAVAGSDSQRRNVRMRSALDDPTNQAFFFLLPDYITLNGQGLYFEAQAANFVPAPTRTEEFSTDVPANYFGLTNQQLQDLAGLSFGGVVAPSNSTQNPLMEGALIGSPAPAVRAFPPLEDMTGSGSLQEPAEGTNQPEITRNLIRVAPGQTKTLFRMNLNTLDANTTPESLVYRVVQSQGGAFSHRDNIGVPLTEFTQGEIDAGVIKYTHLGGNPTYTLVVNDGSTDSLQSVGQVQVLSAL